MSAGLKSLGRIAFEAWLASEVITEVRPGHWAMTVQPPSSFEGHWRGLNQLQRSTWERIGKAVADYCTGPGDETIWIDVD